MAMDFITRDYELSHGKKPRGTGTWAFSEHQNPDVCNPREIFWAPHGTYAEAKKAAAQHYKGKGVYSLWVCT